MMNFLLGQKSANNPKAMLSSLMSKRQKLQEELRTIEKQVIIIICILTCLIVNIK